MHRKRTIISQSVTLLVLVLMLAPLFGCFTIPEVRKVSPQIVTNGSPLSQRLGKVGINLAATEITLQTPTSEALLKKQFWNHFAQGNTDATDLYWKIVSPFVILLSGCAGSGAHCSSGTAIVSALGILAASSGGLAVGTVNGIIETWKGDYSASAANELEDMLLHTVGKSNDELKSAIMASSRDMLSEYIGRQGEARAIEDLERTALVRVIPPPQMDQDKELGPSGSQPWLEGSDSLLDVRIREVTFADNKGWFNSKLRLRVRVETSMYRTGDATLIDKREYTCVSIPRTYQHWSLDSYKNIREELVECNQLLGQHIANDLLGAGMRNDPGRKDPLIP
ncbi:MAG: hypothetical protein A4E19_09275 [Nitrospira sp. SG-bin1]|nr:MAG: hypothetical protein A4E19_09275 [Nitrospira sp. SG-bin1]